MQRDSEKEWYYGNATDKERLGPYSFDEVTTPTLTHSLTRFFSFAAVVT